MTRFAEFGAFFAVQTHGDEASPGAPWRPLAELVTDPAALHARVDAVREALARDGRRRVEEIGLRIAASTAHLGLVARLIAPAIAAATTGSDRLDLDLDHLWWQDRLGAPFPLSVRSRSAGTATGCEQQLAGTAVEAITEAVGREFLVSPRVLWGNVGSAANTAAGLVSDSRPELGAGARMSADALLADLRVDGGGLRSGVGFRRRSCCLRYRLDDAAAICSDCVLAR